MTILIIEDDPDLGDGLRNNLEIEGYRVELAVDGPAGLRALERQSFRLVILDLMLRGMDGFRVLRALREGGNRIPVLILSARDREEDKVRGLRLGADDYVTKPFGLLELLARVEALTRRGRDGVTAGPPVQIGPIMVNPATREVHRGGKKLVLSPKEFDLLWALTQAEGAVVSRATLMEEVWGYGASVLSRTVDTHVAELRRKIEADPASPRFLLTVRKAGYRLAR